MKIETHFPLVEDILGNYRGIIRSDFAAYRNHVYRVINLCFTLGTFGKVDKEKIQIAACFHDIGIWTAGSLDYLRPSELEATKYLQARGKGKWVSEIVEMIEMHHGIRSCADSKFALVDIFRRADIADFSLGIFLMGISREQFSQVKLALPNAGFHKRLAQLGGKWFLKHPLNPLPMFRR